MDAFTIKSANSDASLIFNQSTGEDFVVEFQSMQLKVVQAVCGYTDPQGIARLFQEAAGHSKPWQGQLEYRSLEQEFSLSAACSPLGIVTLAVAFSRIGVASEWSAAATLQVEFGQLAVLASNAQRFFSAVAR